MKLCSVSLFKCNRIFIINVKILTICITYYIISFTEEIIVISTSYMHFIRSLYLTSLLYWHFLFFVSVLTMLNHWSLISLVDFWSNIERFFFSINCCVQNEIFQSFPHFLTRTSSLEEGSLMTLQIHDGHDI